MQKGGAVMTTRLVLFVSAFAAAAGMMLAGCSQEARQRNPAQTRTDGGTTTAPPAAEAAKHDLALVRVVHAVPGGDRADFFAGDQVAFPEVEYKAVTPYRELPDQPTTFRLRPAGQDTSAPLAESAEGLAGGKHYTVVALPGGKDQPATLKVLSDELVPPTEGKSSVRVLNASPDAGQVEVIVGGRIDPVVRNVDGNAASGYQEVDPLEGTLEVRKGDGKRVLARLPDTHLDAGKLYTVIVVGRTAGKPRVEVVMVEDEVRPDPGRSSS
jgi:hypothetical protein